MSQSREMLGSRLGFLLLSAGCAIGLGNVWRFPYITGAYGGAVFVGVYLLCLLAVLPVMIMEFAVGRASRSNMGRALKVLPPEGTRWHIFSKIPLWGSYLLSMFYTTVTGWMLAYCWHSFSGNLSGLDTAGVSFYLAPDVEKMQSVGWYAVLNAAMTQAFFTLSVGIGNMTIFGSYQSKDRSLTGEALWIMSLDTFVAIMAGLIIFPACFAFSVAPNSGPGLIFITLPNIFNAMDGGILWGTLFFVFMSCAALSTVIGVFENIISYSVDVSGMPRRRACAVHFVCLWLASLPCALGFNLLADFQPLGPGTCVLDLEDFLLSNNLLPFGCLLFLLFCSWRRGWGWDNFVAEVNQGQGVRFPRFMKYYLRYGLPCIILLVFVMGYVDKFGK